MPRPAAAAVLPDPSTGTGQTPAPFVTRFPARWLPLATGDTLRAVTAVGDYARGADAYCWAADRTLAAGLSLHPRTVAAGLRTAETLGMVRAVQRPGGTSARVLGSIAEDELMVCVSAYSRNTLAGAMFLTYCVLAVREHLGERTSMARIAKTAGIAPGTARAAVAELAAAGWISRQDTAGAAARYTVHPAPIPGIPTQLGLFPEPRRRPAAGSPAAAQRSSVQHEECIGQLALFAEPDPTPAGSVPTTPVGSAPATPTGSAPRTRSPQQDLLNRPATVGGCSSGGADTSDPRDAPAPACTREPAALAGRASAAPEEPTHLPPLLITAEAYRVLSKAPGLLVRMSRWEQRQAARATGAAIDAVEGDVQRVADRLVRRFACADLAEIRSPYGWLAKRGLTRRGCERPECESGWDTAADTTCTTCTGRTEHARDLTAARRLAQHQGVTGATLAPATLVPVAQRRAVCTVHQAVTAPCAMCAADTARSRWPPEADSATGAALREHLAARRRAREHHPANAA
ncbi:hypothetical protein [Streptomyces rubellomurinus]|uniref:Uncharacterized protein n=1 Tax=Streptomyces rubellomurinus (strain ATCC 31215) TaxID=359131 RepID=A0A0F2TDT8_STRR3|nr:hypothetical protein [Streptomyces rubellomurinus]KJS60666.1 hypothetical protein VM95_19825 [Streptomyces rubellomurinus]